MKHFTTKKEIEEVVAAIAQTMAEWGLENDDWMLGKNISIFYAGVLKRPKEVSRDITIHIVKDKIPWKIAKNDRSAVPPSKSKFLSDYLELQKKYQVGIDFWPLPDEYMDSALITQNKKIINIAGEKINIETLDKYITLRYQISKAIAQKPKEVIRDFYYVNEERYRERKEHYRKMMAVAKAQNDETTHKKIKETTDLYTKMMKFAYPELFGLEKEEKASELKGLVAYKNSEKLSGEIALAEKLDSEANLKKGLIYVFSHFTPADNHFVHFAKAIVTEGGGITSHAAIISREFKVPCLVGVKGVTKQLNKAQSIEINFTKGTINITK